MSITAQLPPKAETTSFTADSASYGQAAEKARSDSMQGEIIGLTAALYRLKLIAEDLTPKTVYDWHALEVREQEYRIAAVKDLRLRVEALVAGASEEIPT